MDPEQTLTEAEEAAAEGRTLDATESLRSYLGWVELGGFEADDGERRARRVRARIRGQSQAHANAGGL